MKVGTGRFGGTVGVVALAVATAAAVGSDSKAQSLGVRTPSVGVGVLGTTVDVPSVRVDVPPAEPIELPKVTLPPAPVEVPVLPVEPPSTVEAPALPVRPPDVPVRPPAAPGEPSLPATPTLPRANSPSPPGGPSSAATPSSGSRGSPASGARPPSPSDLLGPGALPGSRELARSSPVQRRRLLRLAFDTRLRKQPLRQLRRVVRRHRGCLDVLPDRGRRALELRAGLFGREPASRRTIARRIGISPTDALRLERSSLRRLLAAGERGVCGGADALAAGAGGPSTGFAGPGDSPSGGGGGGSRSGEGGEGDFGPAGAVLADVREGSPGVDVGNGEEGAPETLLFFLATLLALLAPLAAVAIAKQRRAGRDAVAGRGGESPLLFLDVDGVIALDLLSSGRPPGQLRDSPLGLIYLPDRAGGLVRELATRFDIVWATGWEHHANTALLSPLGLREELPVLTFGKKARAGSAEWKIKRVDAYARGRPAAWLDDNFAEFHERWTTERSEPTLLVEVDPRAGLTHEHVERLLRWADELAAAQEKAKSNGQRRARAS